MPGLACASLIITWGINITCFMLFQSHPPKHSLIIEVHLIFPQSSPLFIHGSLLLPLTGDDSFPLSPSLFPPLFLCPLSDQSHSIKACLATKRKIESMIISGG